MIHYHGCRNDGGKLSDLFMYTLFRTSAHMLDFEWPANGLGMNKFQRNILCSSMQEYSCSILSLNIKQLRE